MIDTTKCLCLLGERLDSYRVWGRFDNQRPTFDSTDWMLIVGGALLLLIVTYVSYRLAKLQKQDFRYDSPRRMFRELCGAHRLSAADRKLLRKLAASHEANSPAGTFVTPAVFETAQLSPALKSSAHECRRLHHQLFQDAQ